MGPSALAYYMSQFPIRKLGFSSVVANVTIPQPFGMILNTNGYSMPLSVSCAIPAQVGVLYLNKLQSDRYFSGCGTSSFLSFLIKIS